jgi:dTDP-glucose 4,6-dehydratase
MADRIAVTGGLGFIGSAFVRRVAGRESEVLNIDSHTYAADARRIADAGGSVTTTAMDICDAELGRALTSFRPDLVVHFAAETHVTRSESNADLFFRTNVEGTRNVIQAAADCGAGLVVHISTDEVYGSCDGDPFTESDKLPGAGAATSAYAQSKAVADDIALSFADRVPVIVARPTNCFGPWQNPEKAIPRWATRALRGERIPVWGDGRQVRDWMFVDDACAAIDLVARKGTPGEVYNIGPQGSQRSNIEIANMIATAAIGDESIVYLTDYDRPNHDRRYAIDATKLRDLGWSASTELEELVAETVEWYRANEAWWKPLLSEAENLYSDAAAREDIKT